MELLYKVYFHENGFDDVILAAFLCPEDAEDWKDLQNSLEEVEGNYYYME